jgi:predicted lipoprotein with Yx(FWY)xxD motif
MTRLEVVPARNARWIAALTVAALLCGLSGIALATKAHVARAAVVTVQKSKLGKVLGSAAGHTLYLYSRDTKNKSTCYGACASTWIPDLTSGRPVAAAGSGLNSKLLGTTRRSNGKLQVTYNGHPLYLDPKDKNPGQLAGENANSFHGRWWAVNPKGNAVKPPPSCPPQYQGYLC